MDDDLACCRSEIDSIDAAIIDLLAQRFAVVDRVVGHKLEAGLPAVIPERIEEVLRRVKAQAAEKGIPSALAEGLWRQIIAETIAYERRKSVT